MVDRPANPKDPKTIGVYLDGPEMKDAFEYIATKLRLSQSDTVKLFMYPALLDYLHGKTEPIDGHRFSKIEAEVLAAIADVVRKDTDSSSDLTANTLLKVLDKEVTRDTNRPSPMSSPEILLAERQAKGASASAYRKIDKQWGKRNKKSNRVQKSEESETGSHSTRPRRTIHSQAMLHRVSLAIPTEN